MTSLDNSTHFIFFFYTYKLITTVQFKKTTPKAELYDIYAHLSYLATLFKINMLKPLLLLLIMILQTALVHFHSILSIAAVNFAFCTRITRKGLA